MKEVDVLICKEWLWWVGLLGNKRL